MASNVRSLAPIDLRGSLIFGKNLSAFPLNPRNGQMELVNGALWVYAAIDGISTWYPLTNKKNSYVHPVSGITAGTYKSVTVDANGHITAGSNPTTVAGYGITDAVTTGGNSLPMSHGDMSSSTLVANGTTPGQVVSAVSSTLYRTVKYLVQISAGADFHSSEIIATHNGTTALATEYASIMTGNPLATFDVDLSGGNIRLLATPTVAGATFKVIRTAIAA